MALTGCVRDFNLRRAAMDIIYNRLTRPRQQEANMRKRVIKMILLAFICMAAVGSSICANAEEADYKKEEYTLVSRIDNSSGKVGGYRNGDGVLLLPVKEIVEPAGYVLEECSRCGKDEVYNKSDEDAGEKGHYFINWYQNLLSYSVGDQVVELSAENTKIDGSTYSPVDLFHNIGLQVEVNEEKKEITVSSNLIQAVYFYSATCDSCARIQEYLAELESRFPNLNIRKYDIYSTANYDLLVEYGKVYRLPEEKRGFTPSVFISDQVLLGAEIQQKLEALLKDYPQNQATVILESGEESGELEDKNIFLHLAAAFGLGFVNGLSPCSLSIFLFLLSLMLTGREKMMRCGFSFLTGKAVMFFLLGTILYNVVNSINMTVFSKWIDLFMIIFAVCFALLNLLDFYKARAERYGDMNLQLPGRVKKMNHSMLCWGNKFTAAKLGAVIMFGIGMAVATGEFLCTGQIYLSSIVIMVQKGTGGMLPTLLLAVYSAAFVVPLFVIMIVIYFGKKVFGMSEAVLEKIPVIKLISAVLFVAMAVYLILV